MTVRDAEEATMRSIHKHPVVKTIPAILLAASLVGCGSETAEVDQTPEVHQKVQVADELKPLRASHARYQDIANALADGFQLGYRGVVTGCVQKPGTGAMGYHYFHWGKMDDPTIDEMDPEVLVYHTTEDGELKLGAVEWVVPKLAWEAAGNTAPPVVYGQELHIINPALNWYVEHAWLYDKNPLGSFDDWNPEVTCPQ
jgi:hypothetical protein